MLLTDKNVVVFAASGAIAGQVARTCADQGATVWVSARRGEAAEKLAAQIAESGGTAHAAEVDATDQARVDRYVGETVAAAGTVDAVFNGIGGRPADLRYPARLADQGLEEFLTTLQVIAGSQYLTSRAAGLAMATQGFGSVITLSATLSAMAASFMAGITATCGAVEAMTRSLAGELGPSGVRANCVRANAMPETQTIADTFAGQAALSGRPPEFAPPPLGRPTTLADTAGAVAYLVSDLSAGVSGQVLTVSGGAFV